MLTYYIDQVVNMVVTIATEILMPTMVCVFLVAIVLRLLIFYTVKREEWFAKEFDRRVDNYLEEAKKKDFESFFIACKRLLEKTYYEIFEVRALLKRRKPDSVMHWSDRVFLIKQGTAWMVKDLLKHLRHLRFHIDSRPKLLQISKISFQRNPCFSKVFGLLPASAFSDILNILPSMFIVGGIFGTFVGIMKALPELGGMDLNDVQGSKTVMDQFLMSVAFSMKTSAVGIMLSVTSGFVNALFSPEKVFVETVDRMESSLDKLWHISNNNDLPHEIPAFDEHRDPLDALAEQAVNLEFSKAERRGGGGGSNKDSERGHGKSSTETSEVKRTG